MQIMLHIDSRVNYETHEGEQKAECNEWESPSCPVTTERQDEENCCA